MIYCKTCFYPSTKPDLEFEDGICNACISFTNREKINWKRREKDFEKIGNFVKKKEQVIMIALYLLVVERIVHGK